MAAADIDLTRTHTREANAPLLSFYPFLFLAALCAAGERGEEEEESNALAKDPSFSLSYPRSLRGTRSESRLSSGVSFCASARVSKIMKFRSVQIECERERAYLYIAPIYTFTSAAVLSARQRQSTSSLVLSIASGARKL